VFVSVRGAAGNYAHGQQHPEFAHEAKVYIFTSESIKKYLDGKLNNFSTIISPKDREMYQLGTTYRTNRNVVTIERNHIQFFTQQQLSTVQNIIDRVTRTWYKKQKNGYPLNDKTLLHSKRGGTGKSMIGRIVAEKTGGILINKNTVAGLVHDICKCDQTKLKIVQFDEFDKQYIADECFDIDYDEEYNRPMPNASKHKKDIVTLTHHFFDMTGPFQCFNNIIIIATTNSIETIEKYDPALKDRWDRVEEYKTLDEKQAQDFASDYAKQVYSSNYCIPRGELDEHVTPRTLVTRVDKYFSV
jgi:hypothetical protein